MRLPPKRRQSLDDGSLGVELAARGRRGVWGDAREVKAGKTVQFVDLTFEEPKVLLLSGYASGGVYTTFKVRTGIERTPLWETEQAVDKYSRVCVCRSLSVVVHNTTVVDATVQVVVVEIDATAQASDIIGTHPVLPQGQPNDADHIRHTLDAASFPLTSSFPGIWAPYYTRGWSISVNSPGGSRLYVRYGTAAAAVNDYSIIVEDGQTYDTLYNGPMTAICDVADPDPNAYVHVTSLGYNPALVPVY